MGRKFRLGVHWKNEERKSQITLVVSYPLTSLLTVSIPLEKLSYQVSLPISIFSRSPTSSVVGLHQRLVCDGSLPEGTESSAQQCA